MPKVLMCEPADLGKDLSGRRIVVTGANTGIGFVTAKQLVRQGATVVLACRRVAEGEKKAAEIRADISNAKLEVLALDLSSLASVREFSKELTKDGTPLHGLVNNAGVMNTPQQATQDGFEMQIGVNHLGHFLLTQLLLPALEAGAPSRIVNVSSCYHDLAEGKEGKIVLDDLHFASRPYDGWTAYAQSKLANLLHAKGLAKRLAGSGVVAVSVHPGWVRRNVSTNMKPS